MNSFLSKSFGCLFKINSCLYKKQTVISPSLTHFTKLFKKEYTTEIKSDENSSQTETKNASEPIPESQQSLKSNSFELFKANPISNLGWQPTAETHSLLTIDGVPYNKTHIVSIKSSRNNTILSLSDYTGNILYTTSAGTCGFKNSKKSTAVAGQGAGLALTEIARRRGIKNVRVIVRGFGNGRLASIKSLQMGKLNIISITDNTPIPMPFAKPPRPPAKRKV